MDARELLAQRAVHQALSPHSTSYFSAPHPTLDPTIFDGDRMRGAFRRGQLGDVLTFCSQHWRNAESWSTLWLAGSSASYLWAGTDPGDLDLLIGVHYDNFRRANPGFGISSDQISALLNRTFQDFNGRWGRYDRTLYCNPGATDIRAINPYAAYNMTEDAWTVHPDPDVAPPDSPELRASAAAFDARAGGALHGYSAASDDYDAATNDAGRLNAAVRLRHASDVASALFDEVHRGRKLAFAPGGLGYSDPHQYAWAAGKRSGAVQALHEIKAERDDVYADPNADVDRVLIDAALFRRKR